MAKKKSVAKKVARKSAKVAMAQKGAAKKRVTRNKIVFDDWDSYVGLRDGVTMSISFDELVTHGRPPAGLKHCARIVVPLHSPSESGGPLSPETERLWDMEDELCAMLKKHHARCRLVARLTYGGWREIVFQVAAWRSFRTPVGLWMQDQKDYQIVIYEHEGWEFFDAYVRPRVEDRLFMADRSVIDSLVESGSNPAKKHTLEYAFQGASKGLRRVAKALLNRGYKPVGELDYESGTIELAKRMPLDLPLVAEESLANLTLAEKAGIEFVGWGAAVVN